MRPEEQEILYCLEQFGTLKKIQLIRFIQKNRSVTERILNNLIKAHEIFEDGKYVTLAPNPNKERDDKTLMAFWVLAEFGDQINSKDYYRADYPAQIFFIKDNREYEIVAFKPSDEHIISILTNKAQLSKDLHYIFAVNSESMMASIPPMPYTADYAVVQDDKVTFYGLKETQNQGD